MQDSLIDRLKRLAEAQGDGAKWVKIEFPKVVWGTVFDFPALLAHMQGQQAVCDAARERKLWEGMVKAGLRGVANGTVKPETLDIAKAALDGATIALDAALENLENNDGK